MAPDAAVAGAAVQAAAMAYILGRAIPARHRGGRACRPANAACLAAAAGALAFAVCRAAPFAGPVAVAAATRAAGFGALLLLFSLSLRGCQDALVTRIARRIDPRLTPRRLAYTRAVTWVWAGFFAVQLAASLAVLAAAPFLAMPWFVAWAGLPLAVALFAAEFGFRCFWFRGLPHGSASDTWRALLRPSVLGSSRDGGA